MEELNEIEELYAYADMDQIDKYVGDKRKLGQSNSVTKPNSASTVSGLVAKSLDIKLSLVNVSLPAPSPPLPSTSSDIPVTKQVFKKRSVLRSKECLSTPQDEEGSGT